jgi:serine/threonine protein kinase
VSDPRIGSVLAGHRIERLVGRGGMGVVYEAVEIALERTVALKVIAPELADAPGFRRRFMAESKVAASIDHPNVVPIFGAGEHDGVLFLAMRFVAGDDLRTIVERDGPLSPERAAAVIAQVGAALGAAHARELVHRDVKPANVLVTADGHCYLTDFGLVKDLAATAGATQSGDVLGTLDYVAPERVQGGETGPWTDVYALGCVLFFALTGSVVFPLDAPESKLWAHVSEPPPSVSATRPGIPEAFDDVVRTALAKAPRERYESTAALVAAVLAASSSGAAAQPVPRLAALVEAARRSEQALRAAMPDLPAEATACLDTVGRLVAEAQLLHDAVAELPPERIEHQLAEVRSRHVTGKAELVDALAQQLAAQRRTAARLDALYAGLEQQLLDLDALRTRAVAGS